MKHLGEVTIRIHGPINIINRPLEVLKTAFAHEPQAAGTDLLTITKENAQPDYSREIVLPANSDVNEIN